MEHHRGAENPAAVVDSIETVETEVNAGVTEEETLTDLPTAGEINR